MIKVPADTPVVTILQYMNVLKQHIVYLKLNSVMCRLYLNLKKNNIMKISKVKRYLIKEKYNSQIYNKIKRERE